MDPVTALSAVAAAAGLFDFTKGLVKDAKQIRGRGSLSGLATNENVTRDVVSYIAQFDSCSASTANDAQKEFSENDLALQSLSQQCAKTARELLDIARSLRPRERNRKPKLWESTSLADKAVKKRPRIEELFREVEKYRDQIDVRVQKALKENLTVEAREGVCLQQRNYEDLVRRLDCVNKNLIDRLDALLVSCGSFEIFRSVPLPNRSAAAMATTQDAKTVPEVVISAVLDHLHFRSMLDREEGVSAAHSATFKWIFADPNRSKVSWSDSSSYLQSGSGCYWICGKAGSGKSTLMKYIYRHPSTKDLLAEWAGDDPVVMTSFYFWYAGSHLQRSQEGLLRGLLHGILYQHPELIPHAVPDLLIEFRKSQNPRTTFDPALSELTRWFRHLVKAIAADKVPHRTCLFVDGLDEYSGVDMELAQLFLSLSQVTNKVKFVISSRPHAAFTNAFAASPQLELQGLTATDIQKYATDRLQEISTVFETKDLISDITTKSFGVFLWVSLVTSSLLRAFQDGARLDELKELLKELPSELEELYQRMLDRIPARYKKETSRMLQTATWLALRPALADMVEYSELFEPSPLTPLRLYFAIKDPMEIVKMPLFDHYHDLEKQPERHMVSRIQSRSFGILEVVANDSDSSYNYGSEVRFVHRSAVEFLSQKQVLGPLELLTRDSLFDVSQAWFIGALGVMKTSMGSLFIPSRERHKRGRQKQCIFDVNCDFALVCAGLMEADGHPVLTALLLELDRVAEIRETRFPAELQYERWACIFFKKRSPAPRGFSLNCMIRPHHRLHFLHQVHVEYPDSRQEIRGLRYWGVVIETGGWELLADTKALDLELPLLYVALKHGVRSFVWESLKQMEQSKRVLAATRLFISLLIFHSAKVSRIKDRDNRIIASSLESLLAAGADVNYMVYDEVPVWAIVFVLCNPIVQVLHNDTFSNRILGQGIWPILERVVENGADLSKSFYFWSREFSASDFLRIESVPAHERGAAADDLVVDMRTRLKVQSGGITNDLRSEWQEFGEYWRCVIYPKYGSGKDTESHGE